jgi:DNA-binding GntR family transcriptional regulator
MRAAAVEFVVAALRREIIFGRLAPGSRMIENEISERYGIGRHVVRSVLAELQRLGLIQHRPNRGAVVIKYSREEIEQLYEMREILQSAACLRIAMPVSRGAILALTEFNEIYLDSSQRGQLDDVVETNNAFHRTLFGLCGNQFLSTAIEEHWQKSAAIHSYAIGVPAMAADSYRQHRAMIDAMQEQDRALLLKLCMDHMKPALQLYQKAHGGWGQSLTGPKHDQQNIELSHSQNDS